MSNLSNEQPHEEQRKRSFNPNEHLMQLRSKEGAKDYLPVQWRLVWFREQCPQGTIDTDEREVDLDREVEEEVFVWNSDKRRSEKSSSEQKATLGLKPSSLTVKVVELLERSLKMLQVFLIISKKLRLVL